MNRANLNFLGYSKCWWLVCIVGALMVVCGFAYWLFPFVGFAVASQLFGWILILLGVVQLMVAVGPHFPRGWGWWVAGGVIDIFIGFLMVRSVVISEMMLPYVLAIIFMFWGVAMIVNAVYGREGRYWWLYLINGLLLMFIGFFFVEAGWVQNMQMTSFLASLAFIYWGFSVCMFGLDIKPIKEDSGDNAQ